MIYYRYFLLVGILLHLTVIYIVIIQPNPQKIHFVNNLLQAENNHADKTSNKLFKNWKLEKEKMVFGNRSNFKRAENVNKKIRKRKKNVILQRMLKSNTDTFQENVIDENLVRRIMKENNKTRHKFYNLSGIYIFGSYLDHRQHGDPMVRIFALQKLKDNKSLLCMYQAEDKNFITYTEKYEMCENHGKGYGGFIYSCSIPKHFKGLPSYVTLTIITNYEEQESEYYKFKLTSLFSVSSTATDTIGVCLSPLYGPISNSQVIQFVELAKILQASKVFVYTSNITKNTEVLLNYYSSRDIVAITNWTIPQNIPDHEIWNKGQLLAIQDCLYSNMNKYKYIIFLDLDEILIPRESFSWIEMLQKLEFSQNFQIAAGFSFRSAFFDPKYHSDFDQNIPFLQLKERSAKTTEIRSKVIVQPTRVFEVGIHHISRTLGDYVAKNIKESTALIHHYRTCVSSFDQTMQCYPTIKDNSIAKYANFFRKNVTNTHMIISKIYGHLQNLTSFSNAMNL